MYEIFTAAGPLCSLPLLLSAVEGIEEKQSEKSRQKFQAEVASVFTASNLTYVSLCFSIHSYLVAIMQRKL